MSGVQWKSGVTLLRSVPPLFFVIISRIHCTVGGPFPFHYIGFAWVAFVAGGQDYAMGVVPWPRAKLMAFSFAGLPSGCAMGYNENKEPYEGGMQHDIGDLWPQRFREDQAYH